MLLWFVHLVKITIAFYAAPVFRLFSDLCNLFGICRSNCFQSSENSHTKRALALVNSNSITYSNWHAMHTLSTWTGSIVWSYVCTSISIEDEKNVHFCLKWRDDIIYIYLLTGLKSLNWCPNNDCIGRLDCRIPSITRSSSNNRPER